jgi:hypothetical protein
MALWLFVDYSRIYCYLWVILVLYILSCDEICSLPFHVASNEVNRLKNL